MRAGFTLVELLVAFVLLGVAVLSLGAAAGASARWLGEAEAESEAALRAAELIDSLVAVAPGAGVVVEGRYTLDWSVADTAGSRYVRVEARYADGSAARSLEFGARTLPPLPQVTRAP